MRKFRRIKSFFLSPYEPNIIYSGNTRINGSKTVLQLFSTNPEHWEEVFDKPKLFRLL